jgi:hypothetical protein
MRRRIVRQAIRAGLLALALGGAAAAGGLGVHPTAAAQPANPDCWGVVVSQVATTSNPPEQTVGTHASSQPVPRQGVGNVARTDPAPGDHPSDHGTYVASIDGNPATHCP